ncbi:MAG: hypothetical protein ACLRMJ_03885 [Alistipes finegoldii]
MDGEYYLVKNDILAGTMTFSSSKDAMVNVTTPPSRASGRSSRRTAPARR